MYWYVLVLRSAHCFISLINSLNLAGGHILNIAIAAHCPRPNLKRKSFKRPFTTSSASRAGARGLILLVSRQLIMMAASKRC